MGLFNLFRKKGTADTKKTISADQNEKKEEQIPVQTVKEDNKGQVVESFIEPDAVQKKEVETVDSELVPGVGRIPFPAYRGEEPYIFISYAHLDADIVFPIIKKFNDQGYHVWYDEGIAAGNEWTDEIAKALEGCSLFLVFMTPDSEQSLNCRDEIGYAIDDKKPFLAIHLKETTITGGLRLRIGTKQAILKYNMTEEEFEYKYTFAFENLGLPVPEFILENRKNNALANEKAKNIEAGDMGGTSKFIKFAKKAAVRGSAVIRMDNGFEYTDIPAESIYSFFQQDLCPGLKFSLSPKTVLPQLKEISKISVEKFGDGNNYHKRITIERTDRKLEEYDIQTAFSNMGFLNGDKKEIVEWSKVKEIIIDWKHDCLPELPGYARIHRKTGEIILVPEYTLNIGTSKKPGENQFSFDRKYNWKTSMDTERGTAVSLDEISSIAIGKVALTSDNWKDDWHKSIPVGVSFRDGRMLSTYLTEDWVTFCGIDEFGCINISADKISHIDFVATPHEEVFVPDAPTGQRTISEKEEDVAADEDEDKQMPVAAEKYNTKKHFVGDFKPDGIAEFVLKNGNTVKGIANSVCLMAVGMEPRAGSGECLYNSVFIKGNNADDSAAKGVMFLAMKSIKVGQGSDIVVTDFDDEIFQYSLPDKSYFWFIGEDKKYEPEQIKVSDVRSVQFTRRVDPGIEVKYMTIYLKEGCFKAPAAMLAVKWNSGRGIPHMQYAFDFKNFSRFPVKAKNTLMIEILKNGSSGNMFAPATGMDMRAYMKDGDCIDFRMDGYFCIEVLAARGLLTELPRESTKCLDFQNA